MKKLMTMEEAAEYLNIKLSGLRSLVFNEVVPVIKVGRRNRFDPADLESWLKSQRRKSQ